MLADKGLQCSQIAAGSLTHLHAVELQEAIKDSGEVGMTGHFLL